MRVPKRCRRLFIRSKTGGQVIQRCRNAVLGPCLVTEAPRRGQQWYGKDTLAADKAVEAITTTTAFEHPDNASGLSINTGGRGIQRSRNVILFFLLPAEDLGRAQEWCG